jgi:DNA primase
VLIMWQCGYRPVVSTLGSWPGPAQVEKLVRDHERAVVVEDGDQAGALFAGRIKQMIAGRIPVTVRRSSPGSDPAKLGSAGLKPLLGAPPIRVD